MKALQERVVELRRRKARIAKEKREVDGELKAVEEQLIEAMAAVGVSSVKTSDGVTISISNHRWVSLEPENDELGVQPSERADFVRLLLENGYDNVCSFNHNSLRSAFGKVAESEIPPAILPKLRFTDEPRVSVRGLGS